MKTKSTLLSSVLFAVATLSLSVPVVSAGPAKDADQTELGAHMERLNSSWRKLRRQVTDPTQNGPSLALIAKIREAGKGTEQMTPAKAAELPEAKRAQFQADYTAGMKKFYEQIDDLEAALKTGDNEKAGKIVAAINDFQKQSHKEFRKETDKK